MWLVGLIAGVVMCGLAGYSLSAENGRGGLEGAMFGLFFGPLGLLIAVLMPAPPRRIEPLFPPGTVFAMLALVIGLVISAVVIRANQPVAPAQVRGDARAR
jgi:hypothetical protein